MTKNEKLIQTLVAQVRVLQDPSVSHICAKEKHDLLEELCREIGALTCEKDSDTLTVDDVRHLANESPTNEHPIPTQGSSTYE